MYSHYYYVPFSSTLTQGRNFESTLFSEMCKLPFIKKTRTTAYHPESDGIVDRFNRTLDAVQICRPHQEGWDQHLPHCLPHCHAHLHWLQTHQSWLRPKTPNIWASWAGTSIVYAATLKHQLAQIHHFTREHISVMSDKMKQGYDPHVTCPPLQVGDVAIIHRGRRASAKNYNFTSKNHNNYTIIHDLV